MSAFGAEFDLLSRFLDVAALRHRAIAANIANANTPGWKHLGVRFEEDLAASLARGGAAQAARIEPRLVWDKSAPARLDGNNVDVEREMVDLAKNTLLFETFARAAAIKAAMLRMAITGRGIA
jgi:flagellar basal-body rod protein FlgB